MKFKIFRKISDVQSARNNLAQYSQEIIFFLGVTASSISLGHFLWYIYINEVLFLFCDAKVCDT